MKRTCFVVALLSAALGRIGLADASPGNCSFEPDVHHSDRSQGAGFQMGATAPDSTSEMRACSYYALGTMYHFEGDQQKAIENFDKALGWWPTYSDAYEIRGDAYAALGHLDQAKDSYSRADTVVRDDWQGLNSRCWFRAIIGIPLERALSDCSKALETESDDSNTLQSRCFVYYRMKLYDQAIADCTNSLRIRPRMPSALLIKGLSELAKGDTGSGHADVDAAKSGDYLVEKEYVLYGITMP